MVPDAAIELAKGFEGFSPTPYLCPAAVWTIGWGSTRDNEGARVTQGTAPVDTQTAGTMLDRDMGGSASAIARMVPVLLGEAQRAALIDFIYNLGPGAFQASALRQCILRGDYEDVPVQFSRWVRGGGRVLPGLVRRRAAEVALFTS